MSLIRQFNSLSSKYLILSGFLVVFLVGSIVGGSIYSYKKNISSISQSNNPPTKVNSTALERVSDADELIGRVEGESEQVVSETKPPELEPSLSALDIKQEPTPQHATQQVASAESTKQFRQFSGQQFVDFYNSFSYNNVTPINERPYIIGDQAADSYIQNLAQLRGYQLRGESLTFTYQPELIKAVDNLKYAASSETGLNFTLVSGYRSIADQRKIFLNAIDQAGVNRTLITTGSEDAKIESVLATRSIPGYSKHHTGYTVDFGCNSTDLLGFKSSPCFTWISANNYENAKRFGLIPSYPDDALYQGPDPEEWEYVWVGADNLR